MLNIVQFFSVVFGVSIVVVLLVTICTCEGGRDGRLDDFRGWLSSSNINAVT
jgi:hypothetical protein